jgi:hypothetical protein
MTAAGSEVTFERLEPAPGNPYPLGRNVKHDSRSLNFLVEDAFPGTLPVDVEIEWPIGIPVLNQASLGSCTGNAGTEAESAMAEDKPVWTTESGIDPQFAPLLDEPYAIQLYSDATKIDPFQDAYPPEDTGSDGLSIAKVLKTRGVIDKYTHGTSLDSCKIMIQHGAFIVGWPWFDGMFNPDFRGIVTISGGIAGGHEITVFGRKQYFKDLGDLTWYWKLRNHWTAAWGALGDFFVSDDTFSELLAQDGDATFLHFVTSVPPRPSGPPPFSLLSILESWIESVTRWLVNIMSRRTKL